MNYHYLDSNNQPAGPVSLDEIQKLVRDGKLGSNPMVCAVGASEWKSLASVTNNTAAATSSAKSMPFSGTIVADFVGRLVGLVGGILSPKLVETSLSLARTFGQYAILLGGVLGFIAAIVGAIHYNSFAMFMSGIVFLIVLAVAQFAASRFLGASDTLIASTPSRLNSTAFLECTGLLAVLGSVGTLLGGAYVAIEGRSFGVFVLGILACVVLALFGAIALHPRLASIESGSGSAGEEAIGIIAFFLKAALKLVPVAFFLLAIVGCLALIVGMFAPDSQFAMVLSLVIPELPVPGMGGPNFAGASAVVSAALLPMAAYVAYLLCSLPLELWRAVLSLPGKLDLIRRADQSA